MVVADIHGWRAIAALIESSIDGVAFMECLSCGEIEVDFAEVEPGNGGASPELAQLAAFASELKHEEAAESLLALGGSVPCSACGELLPLLPS